jgi:hypothetical protein
MSAEQADDATRRHTGWLAALRTRIPRIAAKAAPALWLTVIALAVLRRAPAECYLAIIALSTSMSLPGSGVEP